MDYHVTATLGPSARTPDVLSRMLEAGATRLRLNTAHVSTDQAMQWINRVLDVRRRTGVGIPLILDLPGTKWRIGEMEPLRAGAGDRVCVRRGWGHRATGELPEIRCAHPELFLGAEVGDGLYIDDAKIHLRIEEVGAEQLVCCVISGGTIASRKGIVRRGGPRSRSQRPDGAPAAVAISREMDHVAFALSCVLDSGDVERQRQDLAPGATLAGKVERQSAVEDVEGIASVCDEVWVCRGDMGAELGPRAMAEAVGRITARLGELRAGVHMAGQVLEHMTAHPEPTRAEICHLHDLIVAGYAGVVLSDETAVGAHPVAACRTAAMFR